MKIRLFILLLIGSKLCIAQHEIDNWLFGGGRHFHFYEDSIAILNDSKVQYAAFPACVSDTLGNLLLYSSGINVWNKEFKIMKNGDSLLGVLGSCGNIIVKQPGNNSNYFIFITDNLHHYFPFYFKNSGIRYSIVNMDMDSGRGQVTNKNILISDTGGYATIKLCAIKHYNGKDIWILMQNNDSVNCYLLCENGLSKKPTVFFTGQKIVSTFSTVGVITANINGNLIANSNINATPKTISQIYSFDNSTGIIKLKNTIK
ncbi:MAG: hypothetical protein NTW54_12185, partial [Bacteroidetes bacterium]|nr:hypothetical protein [Bacteroidota bacterium]